MHQRNRKAAVNETQIEWTGLLSKVDVLEPLSSEQLGWVAQNTLTRSFQKGETIYIPGDASEVVFLLLSGRVRLFAMVRQKELTFDVVRAGTFFGEASLMERTQTEYAQAISFARIGLFELHAFWSLLRENIEVNARVIRMLGERYRLTRGRMTDIALKDSPARLAALVLDLVEDEGVVTHEGFYRVTTHYTHEELATMIGLKRVAVTRAFGTLQDRDLVQLRRRQIYVTDLAGLKAVALGD
jgi:CRP/FNR family transcriptional regulator